MEKIPTLLFVAAAALVDAGGRVLVQQRPEGRLMAGLWEFPGGKVEAGETPEAALARELEEEIGVRPAAPPLPLAFASEPLGDRQLLLLLYLLRDWTGEPRPLDSQRIAWAVPDALRRLAMPPADVPLVARLAEWHAAQRF